MKKFYFILLLFLVVIAYSQKQSTAHIGIFGGDIGYSFLTCEDCDGGFYLRPEIGYHNEAWNIFAYYQTVMRENPGVDFNSLGVGFNYNIIQRQ